jgi:exosortase
MAEKLATRPAMVSPTLPLGARGGGVIPKAAVFSWDDPAQKNPVILLVVFTLLLIYAYWDTLATTSVAWQQELYSHGYIVPFMALGIMWVRRKAFESVPTLERWIGLAILIFAQAVRVFYSQFDMAPIDRLSFVVSLFGLFLMVGGWHLIKWAGPAILFLVFMFPLPSRIEVKLLGDLQTIAAKASTVVLQTIGVSAYLQGSRTITIPGVEQSMEVAEACSGMRMLTIFCAMSVAVVFFIDRPWWDKLVVLLSAVPIALISNITRITLTGLLFKTLPDSELMHRIIHDGAGYFMMVIGMGLLWLELSILGRLSVPEEEAHAPMGGLGGPGRGTVPLR